MSDVRAFLERFFQAIVEKRVEAVVESYLHADRLLVYPEGPRSRTEGWEAVRQGWERFAASRITVHELTPGDDLQVHETGDKAWAASSNRVLLSIDGGPPRALTVRATWILEKHEGGWRIAHEHVSLPHPNPWLG